MGSVQFEFIEELESLGVVLNWLCRAFIFLCFAFGLLATRCWFKVEFFPVVFRDEQFCAFRQIVLDLFLFLLLDRALGLGQAFAEGDALLNERDFLYVRLLVELVCLPDSLPLLVFLLAL